MGSVVEIMGDPYDMYQERCALLASQVFFGLISSYCQTDLHFQSSGVMALQEAAKAYLVVPVSLLEDTNLAVIRTKCKSLFCA
jgi:hypothetical protein